MPRWVDLKADCCSGQITLKAKSRIIPVTTGHSVTEVAFSGSHKVPLQKGNLAVTGNPNRKAAQGFCN